MHNSGYARAHRLMSISILAEAAQTISFSLYSIHNPERHGVVYFFIPDREHNGRLCLDTLQGVDSGFCDSEETQDPPWWTLLSTITVR